MHISFQLPVRGVHRGGAVEQSPAMTSGYMNNCRARDVLENKVRIGQRPGLDKWGDGDRIGGTSNSYIVAMCEVTVVS